MFTAFRQCCVVLLVSSVGSANASGEPAWERVRGPEQVTSLSSWLSQGVLARSSDGDLWLREPGRDWRTQATGWSVQLSRDEDR